MSLPFSTTTVAVVDLLVGDDTVAPGEGASTITGVPAHFSSPSGREAGYEVVDKRLTTEPIPTLSHRNVVVDETTFERWQVVWVDQRHGLGLDHTVAGVNRVRGAG